jgi:hypothetical protein
MFVCRRFLLYWSSVSALSVVRVEALCRLARSASASSLLIQAFPLTVALASQDGYLNVALQAVSQKACCEAEELRGSAGPHRRCLHGSYSHVRRRPLWTKNRGAAVGAEYSNHTTSNTQRPSSETSLGKSFLRLDSGCSWHLGSPARFDRYSAIWRDTHVICIATCYTRSNLNALHVR